MLYFNIKSVRLIYVINCSQRNLHRYFVALFTLPDETYSDLLLYPSPMFPFELSLQQVLSKNFLLKNCKIHLDRDFLPYPSFWRPSFPLGYSV